MRPILILAIATLAVFPTAAAHAGHVAVEMDRPLLGAAFGKIGPAIDLDGSPVRVRHDAAFVAIEATVPTHGWIYLALDEGTRRSVPMQGSAPMQVELAAGALVPGRGAADPEPRLVAAGRLAGGHGGDTMVLPPSGEGTVEVLRDATTTTVRLLIPKSALARDLAGGEVRDVHLAASEYPTAPTFFLGERPHAAWTFAVYFGRPSEDAAAVDAIVRALRGEEAGPSADLATFGLGAAILAVALVARILGERAPRGTGPTPLLDAAIEALGRPRAVPRRVRVGAVAIVCLFLVPAPAAARFVAGPLPPAAELSSAGCPEDAPVRAYDVTAIDTPIYYNRFGDRDPEGMMYVLTENLVALREERSRLEAGIRLNRSFPTGEEDSLFTPLVLRAAEGECLEITLRNALGVVPPSGGHPPEIEPPIGLDPSGVSRVSAPDAVLPGSIPRRVSMHVHGLPVDPEAAGSPAGFNADSTIGIGQHYTFRAYAFAEGVYFFHDHGDVSSVGGGTLRALDGNFLGSTTHGLFGAVVVEPPGSTWRHPSTGLPAPSGWRADILPEGAPAYREFVIFYHDPQLIGLDGSVVPEPMADHGLNYRVETMSRRIFENDDRCDGNSTRNNGLNPCRDPALVYSSFVHGDPGTPIPRAYMRDRVKMHVVHAGMEEAHAHHIHNHRWRAIEGNARSTFVDSQLITPGETWTQTMNEGAGGEGPTKGPGDAIFHCHLFPHLYGGMWGIFRTHDRAQPDLLPLPENVPLPVEPGALGFPGFMIQAALREQGSTEEVDDPRSPGTRVGPWTGERPPRPPAVAGLDPRTGLVAPAPGAPYVDPCPPDAPLRAYHLTAIEVRTPLNGRGDHNPKGHIYALAEDAAAIRSGAKLPEPAVLRTSVGECMTILLQNDLPSAVGDIRFGLRGTKLSIHPHLYAFDVLGSDGLVTGWNFDSGIFQGETITYRYYSDDELQTAVWHDHTAGLQGIMSGLYGATLVEPAGAMWRDPYHGGPIYTTGSNGANGLLDSTYWAPAGAYSQMDRADIIGTGFRPFREFFLAFQDFVPAFDSLGRAFRPPHEPDSLEDSGFGAFNYRSEPLVHRLRAGGPERVFDSTLHGDPGTPLFEAYPRDPVVFRYHHVPFEEVHAFTVQGHRWRFGYNDPASSLIDTQALSVSEAFNAYLDGGAGGPLGIPGDYLYRGTSVDDLFTGAWGIFRVHETRKPHLLQLPQTAVVDVAPPPGPVDPCPAYAPTRSYDIHAIHKEIVYNGHGDHDPLGMVYVLSSDVERVRTGQWNPEPLTLRVFEGDCVRIRLTNSLPGYSLGSFHGAPQPNGGSGVFELNATTTRDLLFLPRGATPEVGNRTGLFAHMLLHDVRYSGGVRVGYNPDSTIGPGETREYVYYADTADISFAMFECLADPLAHRRHGLFGGIVVLPSSAAGALVLDPATGRRSVGRAVEDIRLPDGSGWRDAAVYFQNGLALLTPEGRPVPARESHAGTAVDAAEAAKRALFIVSLFTGDGTDRIATVKKVQHHEVGWLVEIEVVGWHLSVVVNAATGRLHDLEATRHPGPDGNGGNVLLLDTLNHALAGRVVRLDRGSGVEVSTATGPDGRAWFGLYALPRASVLKLSLAGVAGSIPIRTDPEGRLDVELRGDPAALHRLVEAAQIALAYTSNHGWPVGGIGASAVDARGDVWRVTLADALREYHVEIDPRTRAVVSFAFEAYGASVAIPAFLPDSMLSDAADDLLDSHFGHAEDGRIVEFRRDRFGVWRCEYLGGGWSTTLMLDGATGRPLYLHRVPADGLWRTSLAGAVNVTARLRTEGGAPLAGLAVGLFIDGRLVEETAVEDDGFVRFTQASFVGARTAANVTLSIPALDLLVPWNVAPALDIYSEFLGLRATSLVKAATAIELAERWLPPNGPSGRDSSSEPEGGTFPRALIGLYHRADGWHVVFGNEHHAVTLVVDDTHGVIETIRAKSWQTPKDTCSGQVGEHFGPAAPPNCPWSFTTLDEEDQGNRGVSYRSEPLEWRMYRFPDAAYAHSSHVHDDPWTPILRAYVGDPMRIHLAAAGTKMRTEGFLLAGHVWPQQPLDPGSPLRESEGGLQPNVVRRLDLLGGAGGVLGIAGDYLYQGAVQRHEAEGGQWGLLRVYGARVPALRALGDLPTADVVRPPPPTSPPRDPPCSDNRLGAIHHAVRQNANGDWVFSSRSEGPLVTPGSGKGHVVLSLEVTPFDPSHRLVLVASGADGWSARGSTLNAGVGKMTWCIDVARHAGNAPLVLNLRVNLVDAAGTLLFTAGGRLPFLPTPPPSPPTETPTDPPRPAPLTPLGALAAAAAALLVRRRRA